MDTADQLLDLFVKLPDEAKAQVITQTQTILANRPWTAQLGPQTEAYFSMADEILFGGQAGGGKSDLLIGLALNEGQNAVIFRNGLKNVTDLQNRACRVIGTSDYLNKSDHIIDLAAAGLGAGRTLEFGSLDKPGAEEDWQGRRRDFMGFDEAAQQNKERVMFVRGWNGSVYGRRSRVVYATNPPLSAVGNWLVIWFAPWLDEMFPTKAKPVELRWFINNKDGDPIWVDGPGTYAREDGEMSEAKSRTFIPSALKDNKYLRDTDYIKSIDALPEPMRSAMKSGNFMAAREDGAYQVIPALWVQAAQRRHELAPRKYRDMIALGVDIAQGGPDKTTLAPLLTENYFAEPTIVPGVNTKDGTAVAGLIVTHQKNGAPIGIDMTGGWGGGTKTKLEDSGVAVIPVVFSEKTGAADPDSKIFYANIRAEIHWEMRRALDPNSGEDIMLPPGQKILAEATAAHWKLKGGMILIQEKAEIRALLGSSPDIWDAICIAWYIRKHGIKHLKEKGSRKSRPTWADNVGESDPFANDGFSL